MRNKSELLGLWKKLILPLCFVWSYVVNVLFYYLGLAQKENPAREYGFMLFCVLFAVCVGLTFLYLLWKERIPLKTWVLLCCVGLFFAVSFMIGLRNYGMDSLLFSYLKKFIIFSIPAFLAGICAAKWKTLQDFSLTMEKLGFFVFPVALIYFNQVLFDANPFNYGRDLGIIHYMSFAYTLMPFLLVQIIRFSDGETLAIPFVTRTVQRPQLIRGVMILIEWVAIYASGTRGTIVCVVVFCGLLLVSKAVRGKTMLRTIVIVGIMLGALVFNLFVYAPAGMKGLGRMNMFLEGLKEGKIVTAIEDENVEENIDNLVTSTQPVETEPNAEDPTEVTQNPTEKPPSAGNEQPTISGEQLRNRGSLYKVALKEFLKSPVTGMGPGGYSEKYGKYPHNAILELLAETGLVGTLVLFALVFLALKRMLIDGWKDDHVQYFLLFIMAYAVYANISGTVWDCRALLCALGFGLVYNPLKDEKK